MSGPFVPQGAYAMSHPTIAVMDDNQDIQLLIQEILTGDDYRVVPCGGPAEVHSLIAREQPRLIIVAVHLHDHQSCLSLLARLRGDAATGAIPLLGYSADHRFFRRYAAELERLGAATLELPFDLDELLAQIAAWSRPARRPQARRFPRRGGRHGRATDHRH
jgi:DNA-binding response OmpR family regulator